MIPPSARLRVTAAHTDLSRVQRVEIPLMAPDSTLELFIDDAGLERIGVALSKRCQRACCAVPQQLRLEDAA